MSSSLHCRLLIWFLCINKCESWRHWYICSREWSDDLRYYFFCFQSLCYFQFRSLFVYPDRMCEFLSISNNNKHNNEETPQKCGIASLVVKSLCEIEIQINVNERYQNQGRRKHRYRRNKFITKNALKGKKNKPFSNLMTSKKYGEVIS